MFLTNANMEKNKKESDVPNEQRCSIVPVVEIIQTAFPVLVLVSVFLSKTLTLVVTVVTSTCCDQCLMPSHTYLTSCSLLHLYI